MNLFTETTSFWGWFGTVIRNFLRIRPWTTLAIILMASASRVFYVLAFFMPLKVILLAGSPGVPRYFQFFITPEQKTAWIVGFTLGAIACYILTMILDALVDRLALAGSAQVLRQAQVIPLLNNQQAVVQGYYAKFCGICADSTFVTAGLLVGLLINTQLFIFVVGIMVFFYVFTAFFARSYDQLEPRPLAAYIRDNLLNYLKVLASLVFLSSFIVLLIPLLLSEDANILAAILSIIILRQLAGSLVAIVKDTVTLAGARHRIDALVFKDIQLQEKEAPEEVVFRELFNKRNRNQRAEHELGRVMALPAKPDVTWLDPVIPGVSYFAITVAGEQAAEKRHYRMDVYSPKHLQKLEHEAFLFSHVSRSGLHAPKLITQYFAGSFQCQICEAGSGERPTGADWGALQKTLIGRRWGHSPPPGLVAAYCSSSPLLPQRLDENLVSSMQVAVDTEAEADNLGRLLEKLPVIREKLEKLPLYIYNPDLQPHQIMLAGDGEPLVMTWCRWSLEPLGAGIPINLKEVDLAEILDTVRATRNDVSAELAPADILFAAGCQELERMIRGRRYKAALQQAAKILTGMA
ncbi:hypothetical protein ACHHRT_11115 [Desulfurivibrio sp. D14AmB]|uniref:hypothetical protein n=1 Tax=Desulfurivibrio sp. D14AmB TaxID=3374370 RepID=UPI00376F0230